MLRPGRVGQGLSALPRRSRGRGRRRERWAGAQGRGQGAVGLPAAQRLPLARAGSSSALTNPLTGPRSRFRGRSVRSKECGRDTPPAWGCLSASEGFSSVVSPWRPPTTAVSGALGRLCSCQALHCFRHSKPELLVIAAAAEGEKRVTGAYQREQKCFASTKLCYLSVVSLNSEQLFSS